eukprot:1150565-Pelagomonas_calceolata.AAC.8
MQETCCLKLYSQDHVSRPGSFAGPRAKALGLLTCHTPEPVLCAVAVQLSAFKAKRAALRSHHASPNPKAAAEAGAQPTPAPILHAASAAEAADNGDAIPMQDQEAVGAMCALHACLQSSGA